MASGKIKIHEIVESQSIGPSAGANITDGLAKVRKMGNLVIVTFNIRTISSSTAARIALFTLPEKYRPSEYTLAVFATWNGELKETNFYVNASGEIGQNFTNSFTGSGSGMFIYSI